MKRGGGGGGLNPYAEAYIPLSKRGDDVAAKQQQVWMMTENKQSQKQEEEEEAGEFEMDIDYIQMAFPSISHDSIRDLYIANHSDLEATLDMLTQLEFDPMESSENLPDSLDIWDVSQPASSSSTAESSSLKLKNVAPEVAPAPPSDSTDPSKVRIA